MLEAIGVAFSKNKKYSDIPQTNLIQQNQKDVDNNIYKFIQNFNGSFKNG